MKNRSHSLNLLFLQTDAAPASGSSDIVLSIDSVVNPLNGGTYRGVYLKESFTNIPISATFTGEIQSGSPSLISEGSFHPVFPFRFF